MSDFDSSSEEYLEKKTKKNSKNQQTRKKRRKLSSGLALLDEERVDDSLSRLFFQELGSGDPSVQSFQDIIDRLLPDFLQTRLKLQEGMTELDQNLNIEKGESLRPPTRAEVSSLISGLTNSGDPTSVSKAIAERKLKLDRDRRRAGVSSPEIEAVDSVTPLPAARASVAPHPDVIEALYTIKTTPFASSFLSRLQGTTASIPSSAIAVDWETVTPWMSLMSDIRDHYVLSHPERERPVETLAPIIYTSLEELHLREVHELLERVFWKGINVADSLDYYPERCTVIASYKRLVIGVAILSSPRETYITYLAVRAGWDNARIARSMLYHLIMLNPKRDITLHVSVNNSAMLLYNRFGFKAEEFVAGFYEQYLDPNSRASKNAFRLRLRQQ
ncbi:hypothetical protein C0995_002069 [Termitomyces sp. Mi166|nr:hypothetical protein C0995_002069 [Termitomyces sp. Mi166\